MSSKINVVLASTLHDPENRLSQFIRESHQALKHLFKSTIVVTTPNTHSNTLSLLGALDFEVYRGGETVLSTYRTALKLSITANPEHILYCDFDRILHWAKTYPNELKNTSNAYLDHDFLLIGRTPRAFKTHAETQTMTEDIANQIASKILGFKETRDIISACWRLTPRSAEKLLQLPNNNTYGFYCEWPITAWREAENPVYLEVEGLEWETPDRYRPEIHEKGYKQWLQSFQTPREWQKRVEMLRDFIESTLKHLLT